VVGVFPHAPWL